jgi:gliding motility-associated-like protein
MYSMPGCFPVGDSGTVQVTSISSLTLQPVPACYGMSNGIISAVVEPSESPYSYQWSNNSTSTIDSSLAPGTYSLTVTGEGHCTASATVIVPAALPVTLNITPADTAVYAGYEVQLGLTLSGCSDSAVTSYQWSSDGWLYCNECAQPVIKLTDGDTMDVFNLKVLYGNNCTASSSVALHRAEHNGVALPTAFTPNGDGKNDLYITPANNVKTFHMDIYNRWGSLVFSSSDAAQGWDGQFKGEPQAAEDYQVMIEVVYIDGTSQHAEQVMSLIR